MYALPCVCVSMQDNMQLYLKAKKYPIMTGVCEVRSDETVTSDPKRVRFSTLEESRVRTGELFTGSRYKLFLFICSNTDWLIFVKPRMLHTILILQNEFILCEELSPYLDSFWHHKLLMPPRKCRTLVIYTTKYNKSTALCFVSMTTIWLRQESFGVFIILMLTNHRKLVFYSLYEWT